MAKELPFFKFEPGAWDSGMIQLCSLEAKGLFIEICALYWSRLGELPYALALQKLCRGNAKLMQELEQNQIFALQMVNDRQFIVINFLDEQLQDFNKTSEKRQKAALKRWDNQAVNANAMQMQSKSNAIREDKRREEEIREDKIREDKIREDKNNVEGVKTRQSRFAPPLLSEVKNLIEKNNYQVDAERFHDFYTSKNWMVGKNKMKDWHAAVRNWHRKNQQESKEKAGSPKEPSYAAKLKAAGRPDYNTAVWEIQKQMDEDAEAARRKVYGDQDQNKIIDITHE